MTKTQPKNRTSLEHAELLTRAANLNADSKLIKSHQWQATYYSLLSSGGILALLKYDSDLFKKYSQCFLITAIIISVLQSFIIVFFQGSFARSLRQYQSHGKAINDLLDRKTHIYTKINVDASIKRELPKSQRTWAYFTSGPSSLLDLQGPYSQLDIRY